jgi:hypothetical protein
MKKNDIKVVANIVVGKPDVDPAKQGHVRGVFQGNHPHITQRPKGIEDRGPNRAEGSARRSTGIRPKGHDVIDPRMPKISPA